MNPEFPGTYRELARTYAKAGDYEEAISWNEKALAVLPKVDLATLPLFHRNALRRELAGNYYDMGQAEMGLNDYAAAANDYQTALSYVPENTFLYANLADTYHAQGDLNQAIWYNEKGMAANQENYYWPFAVAKIYQEQGNKEKALEYGKKALELSPGNLEIESLISEIKSNH